VRVDTAIGSMQVILPTWRSTIDPQPGLTVWVSWHEDASVLLVDDR